jgi:16S rRNA (cytidine1402-2'-O)-methyltransferase
VATPIGNLKDLSQRAVETLRTVDFIAAEDTRHSRVLLTHYGISTPMVALHEHNENKVSTALLDRIQQGESAALISDAGTPLISDPGFPLVQEAIQRHIQVSPIPGPCALTAALSASGLATNRFRFEGFPPRTSSARKKLLEALVDADCTTIFYESSHRIAGFCDDISAVMPPDRAVCVARELTKIHESIVTTTCGELAAWIRDTPHADKGEFVVVLQAAPEVEADTGLSGEHLRVLKLLLEECSVKTAVALTVRITGAKKDLAYAAALALKA